MKKLQHRIRGNLTLWLTLVVLAILFFIAIGGMETKDWVITFLRGLSVGSVTFLVASGFSLIFGLMEVLNMAHGTLFMIGAYIGWTVVVRPDTFIDFLAPFLLVIAGFFVFPIIQALYHRVKISSAVSRWLPWVSLIITGIIIFLSFSNYPITKWDPAVYSESPVTNAFEASQGVFRLPEPKGFDEGISPLLILLGLFLGGVFGAVTIASFNQRSQPPGASKGIKNRFPLRMTVVVLLLLISGIFIHYFNTPITEVLFNINRTWLFILAIFVSMISGIGIGALMEITMIGPLYERHIYQLMLTLGLSAIGVEVVRAIWGLQEFTMPRPSIFDGTGEGCPAETIGDVFTYQCATIKVLGGRVRTYNEIFVPILGIIVLIAVWILLQRTRLGMVVRAGVQDREMVEALGINVRQVFTTVFALGVGLAALGGIIGAPSTGLTTNLGVSLLLNVLIALAIGGLTSYPGAALGSLIVGMLQQFIIKYGQIGINIPFLDEPFHPSPPLVPATTMLLLVIILLVMPNGLLGRKE